MANGFPRATSTKLTNTEFTTSFYLRLGITPTWADPSQECNLCKNGEVLGENFKHWFTCKQKGTLIHRHDAVVDEIRKLFNHARLKELPISQAFPLANNQIKPDIRLQSPKVKNLFIQGENFHANANFDIRLTHPCTDTNIEKIKVTSDKV